MNATTMAVVSALALMGLAGCTGSFDVDQTEPFRVQLDGAPQTVVVREGAEPREVNVETCPEAEDPCDVGEVDVQVKVTKTSMEACSVKVTVKTTSGEVLDEQVIDVGGDSGSNGTMTTDDNATGNGTTTVTETTTTTQAASGDVIIQNLVIDVRGNRNIVVVTEALSGAASVDIQAIQASGNADVDADQDGGATVSPSETMTATSSPTDSTSGNTTPPS
jgi:hypothetical protein